MTYNSWDFHSYITLSYKNSFIFCRSHKYSNYEEISVMTDSGKKTFKSVKAAKQFISIGKGL